MYATSPRKKPKTQHDLKDRVDVVGYLMFVGRRTTSKFFEFYVGLEHEERRMVCFKLDVRNILIRKLNGGVILTKLAKSGTDLVFDQFSTLADKEPPFPFKPQYPVTPTSLLEAIEDLPEYARITALVKVLSSEAPGMSRDGLSFQSYNVIDNSVTEPRQLTLYGDLVGQLEIQQTYRITYFTISTYNNSRVLKASERSSVSFDDALIMVPRREISSVPGTITGVVISSLQRKKSCPICKRILDVDGSILTKCLPCGVAHSQSSLISGGCISFSLTVSTNNMLRKFECEHEILEEFLECPSSEEDRFLSAIMDRKVTVNHVDGIVDSFGPFVAGHDEI